MATLTCARCSKKVQRRVVYGYPSPELLEQASRGEVVLGGCQLGRPRASWLCDECRPAWLDELGARPQAESPR